MSRPKKCRMVDAVPGVRLFKPQGIPARLLEEIYLSFEGCPRAPAFKRRNS
jgi:predicted DNA-binding protein (UPF0251 family)